MPKVTRGPAPRGRRSDPVTRPGAQRAPRRRAPARPGPLSQLRNRISARIRAARYRVGEAARLASIACLVLIGGGMLALLGSGRLADARAYAAGAAQETLREAGFRLRAVDVAGAERAEFAAIRDALGARFGQSIFAVDLQGARARVEQVDWVGEAAVFRLLPGRIQVVVTEQVPLARWQIEGQVVLIDTQGERIDRIAPGEYSALPLVVGEGAAAPAPALLAALDQFPAVGLRVEAAQRVGERRWTLFLDTGAELHLPERDGEAALAIVNDLEVRRGLLSAPAQSIDLRNPAQIVVHPRDDAPGAAAGRPEGREA